MNKTIFNMGKMLVLGVLGMIGLASCTEEPDGSNQVGFEPTRD